MDFSETLFTNPFLKLSRVEKRFRCWKRESPLIMLFFFFSLIFLKLIQAWLWPWDLWSSSHFFFYVLQHSFLFTKLSKQHGVKHSLSLCLLGLWVFVFILKCFSHLFLNLCCRQLLAKRFFAPSCFGSEQLHQASRFVLVNGKFYHSENNVLTVSFIVFFSPNFIYTKNVICMY